MCCWNSSWIADGVLERFCRLGGSRLWRTYLTTDMQHLYVCDCPAFILCFVSLSDTLFSFCVSVDLLLWDKLSEEKKAHIHTLFLSCFWFTFFVFLIYYFYTTSYSIHIESLSWMHSCCKKIQHLPLWSFFTNYPFVLYIHSAPALHSHTSCRQIPSTSCKPQDFSEVFQIIVSFFFPLSLVLSGRRQKTILSEVSMETVKYKQDSEEAEQWRMMALNFKGEKHSWSPGDIV